MPGLCAWACFAASSRRASHLAMRLAPAGRLQLLGLLVRLRQLRLQRLLAIFQRLLGLRLGVESQRLDARLALVHKLDDRLVQETG